MWFCQACGHDRDTDLQVLDKSLTFWRLIIVCRMLSTVLQEAVPAMPASRSLLRSLIEVDLIIRSNHLSASTQEALWQVL